MRRKRSKAHKNRKRIKISKRLQQNVGKRDGKNRSIITEFKNNRKKENHPAVLGISVSEEIKVSEKVGGS